MGAIIGSARIDENRKVSGGKAGDQKNGFEVSTQAFYVHKKGWVILRAKSDVVANKLSECMKKACANNNIGYDQSNRYSLYNEAKKYNFDVSKVTIPVETDCSALVRVCLAYAGINVSDFATSGEAKVIMDTGKFDKLDFTKESDLKNGHIIVTKTSRHTAIVVSGGKRTTQNKERNKDTEKKYYKAYKGLSKSLVDALIAVGAKEITKDYRAKIAKANGLVKSVEEYKGQAGINEKMLELLKKGKLVNPE